MNVQCRLIQELMLYEIKLNHNTEEAIKNICCAKNKGAVDHKNQIIQEILLRLQESWQSDKFR